MVTEVSMDTAKAFKPRMILVWRKVQGHPETQRIVGMFPEAHVEIVDRQRIVPSTDRRRSHSIVAGKRILMIGEASSFVHRFDGCLGKGVRCAPYLRLVPVSNGCPYFCTYCYLACVYRDHLPFMKININHARMFEEIRESAVDCWNRVAFNMGEMLDSLALDHVTRLAERLVPFFSHQPNACLMLLTKSANVDGLLRCEPNPQVVVSWSLNAQRMIETYELGTASLTERIEAARQCQEHGYRIRLRIDPGILHDEWQTDYADLIRMAMMVLEPENITLGMLRLVPGHLSLARHAYGDRANGLRDTGLSDMASDGKLRYPAHRRVEFYRSLIKVIRSFAQRPSISLCRETPEVWSQLSHLCDPGRCNCLVW
ncbi:MAG: spore photoproduct lyase family protein [Phycisphaerales bacterium]